MSGQHRRRQDPGVFKPTPVHAGLFPPKPAATVTRWGRLAVNVRLELRRGAWYPVLSVGSEEVVLEVRRRSVIVARTLLDISDTAPDTWSLVPQNWGGPYVVCPKCAERVRLRALTRKLSCLKCHGRFAVDAVELSLV